MTESNHEAAVYRSNRKASGSVISGADIQAMINAEFDEIDENMHESRYQ